MTENTTRTQSGYCATHELPLDQQGGCQLCRLGQIPSQPPAARAGRWIGAALLGLILAGAILLVTAFEPAPVEAPERGVSTRSEAAPQAQSTNVQTSAVLATSAARRFEDARMAEEPTNVEPGRADGAERVEAPIDGQAKLWALAREAVTIRLYVRADCQACVEAVDYMRDNDIEFEERDIDRDEAADRRIRELSPERAVPLLELDDTVMGGFSPDAFEARRTQAATKHLQDEL